MKKCWAKMRRPSPSNTLSALSWPLWLKLAVRGCRIVASENQAAPSSNRTRMAKRLLTRSRVQGLAPENQPRSPQEKCAVTSRIQGGQRASAPGNEVLVKSDPLPDIEPFQ